LTSSLSTSKDVHVKRPPPDAVETILEQWRSVRPDLDLTAMGVVGRLGRLAAIGGKLVNATLVDHELNVGEFDVLAALRRAGPPHRLTPTKLSRALMLSSGAMTNRIDRLEDAGLVERLEDPDDRRGVLVGLTRSGLARVDAAVTAHVANEAKILAALTRSEQAQLSALLRKLLVDLEPRQEDE
jgi:DNA-binding MarR family transcriptional regulator